MTKPWNYFKPDSRFGSHSAENSWQSYYEEEPAYNWFKKTTAALVLFALVYGAHVSNTYVGQEISGSVRQVLAMQTDFSYYAATAAKYAAVYWPNAAKLASTPVWQQVQTTLTQPADPLRYMAKPVEGQVITAFGWQNNPAQQAVWHDGISIAAPAGTSVKAAAAGQIKAVTGSAQWGKMLTIDHGKNVETIYGQLNDIMVKEGEFVSQGQIIARIGQNGTAEQAELYFELRENGKAVEPLSRITSETAQ